MGQIALGTAQFGMNYGIANKYGQVNDESRKIMLDMCLYHNINMLDTAINYGESESVLGTHDLNKFDVITKLPPLPEGISEITNWVRTELNASLKRLNIARVNGFLMHRPSDLLGKHGKEILSALCEAKDNGLISKIGVSIYDPDELNALMEIHAFDIVQAPFNIIDRKLVNSGWLDCLYTSGVEVHTRSTFLQGLLLMPLIEQQRLFRDWENLWKSWHEWLQTNDAQALHMCLAWSLSHKKISRVIVGADTPGHLESIITSSINNSADNWPPFECSDEGLVNPSKWGIGGPRLGKKT